MGHVLEMAFLFVVLLFSIICHEVAHGLVALWLGDKTAKYMGRLTLNPIPHIDPFGSIILPAIALIFGMPVFGWAKPVPVSPWQLRYGKFGSLCVSLAGITFHLVVAAITGGFIRIVHPTGTLLSLLLGIVMVNVSLAVVNAMPLPPLDGFRAVSFWLPSRALQWVEEYQVALLIVGLLVMMNLGVIGPIIGVITSFFVGV